MAERNAGFSQGSGEGKVTGVNPVNVPLNRVDDSGVMVPTAELASQIRDTEKNVLGGKKLVGMNDTLGILHSLHTSLSAAHAELVSSGVRHEGLAQARNYLHGDSSLDPNHPGYLGVGDHIHFAKILKADQTPLAWQHMQEAGQKLHAAYNALSAINPSLKKLGVPHSVNGVSMNITAGQELLHISKAPSNFKAVGRAPNNVRIGKRVIKAEDVAQGLRRASAYPEQSVREDLRREVAGRLKGTPRRRKSQGPIETVDPKARDQNIEPLGVTATDLNRTGDWSGSENTRGMPESVIAKIGGKRGKKGSK